MNKRSNQIINFLSSTAKKSITINNKVHGVRLQRDVFGRKVAISMNETTDVEKVLTFPLTPVPM